MQPDLGLNNRLQPTIAASPERQAELEISLSQLEAVQARKKLKQQLTSRMRDPYFVPEMGDQVNPEKWRQMVSEFTGANGKVHCEDLVTLLLDRSLCWHILGPTATAQACAYISQQIELAAGEGRFDPEGWVAVRAMVSAGGDPNSHDWQGNTVLLEAIQQVCGLTDVVLTRSELEGHIRFLVQHGADPDRGNDWSCNPRGLYEDKYGAGSFAALLEDSSGGVRNNRSQSAKDLLDIVHDALSLLLSEPGSTAESIHTVIEQEYRGMLATVTDKANKLMQAAQEQKTAAEKLRLRVCAQDRKTAGGKYYHELLDRLNNADWEHTEIICTKQWKAHGERMQALGKRDRIQVQSASVSRNDTLGVIGKSLESVSAQCHRIEHIKVRAEK